MIFEYFNRLFCAKKRGWNMLVYAPGWILASQLQLILKLYPLFQKLRLFRGH